MPVKMDGVKISEIPGLMLSKHLSDSCDCEDGEGCREYRLSPEGEGWDKAIEKQGQVRLSLSREKLAIRLFEISYPNLCWEPYKAKNPNSFEGMMLIKADSIIENQKDLFVVVK